MEEALAVFFSRMYKNEILEAVREGKGSIAIDYSLLEKFDSELADSLLSKPEEFLEKARAVVRDEAVKASYEERDKIKIDVRVFGIPDSQKSRVRDLRHVNIGRLIRIEGIVKRASDVMPRIEEVVFECGCGNRIRLIQKKEAFTSPEYCEQCGKREKFKVAERSLYDARIIRLEDMFEATMGERPGQLAVFLKNDLTTMKMQRKTDAGARLRITGILRERHQYVKGVKSVQLEIFMEANHIESIEVDFDELEITNEDKEAIKVLAASPDIYQRLVASFAPTMYGLGEIKEGMILQMFGGVPDVMSDGIKIRGDIHILLVGDPSTGKTQLLTLASSIVPRGRYVSGKGATAAGLTATVVKDEEFMGGWVLEAGAIVLANKGVICIDEFDKMSEEDQVNLHEAMSKQTVSIAKATISATLPAQTSVIAGANPKFSRFDPYKSIADQIDIPETLLSRFDLKFVLRDVPDREKDEKMIDHVIKSRLKREEMSPIIDTALLKKYIAYARQSSKPTLSEAMLNTLKEFYLGLRGKSSEGTIPITQRQYEALVRLAQASAKIRLDSEVREEDAQRAIRIMEASIVQLGYDPATGKIDIDKVEARVSSSQRGKYMEALSAMDELKERFGEKLVPKDEFIKELEMRGVPMPEQILSQLMREGELYEPRPNFIAKLK